MRRNGAAGSDGLRPEILALDDAGALSAAWDALSASPLSPNPYFARRTLEAFVASGLVPARSLRLACLWRGDRLEALLPIAPRGPLCGWGRASGAFANAFTTLSTPLVAVDAADAWADALLALLMADARGSCFVFPRLSLGSPAGAALAAAAARGSRAHRLFDVFERPVATRAESYEAFAQRAYGRNRRKGLRRLRNGLARIGDVRADAATTGFGSAVDEFLALERSGWKGRRGTSLADDARAAAMLRLLFSADAPPGTRRVDRLLVDGRPAAISMSLVQDGVAFLWKTAFDENLRRLAPGILLEDEIVSRLHEEPGLRRLDSAATAATALDALYDERETIADLVVCDGPTAGLRLAAEAARRDLRRRARRLRDRLRARGLKPLSA